MEEEAVRCDAVSAEGEVLGVPPAPFHCAGHSPHKAWQGPPAGLQGQAGSIGFLHIEHDLGCGIVSFWVYDVG